MDYFILILPQIIAGLIVAAVSGGVALMFHIRRRRRRIAELGRVIADCRKTLQWLHNTYEILRLSLDGVNAAGKKMVAMKQCPSEENMTEVEMEFKAIGNSMHEQMQIVDEHRVAPLKRMQDAEDELRRLIN